MRLKVLESGYSPWNRLRLLGMRVLLGPTGLDAARGAYYQPEAFSRPYFALQQEVLRGPSSWSVGERELMVAFISARNRSRFCAVSHRALAAVALKDRGLVRAVLEDFESAPVDNSLKAVLRFLEKLTLEPELIADTDVDLLHAAGLTDRQIEDAVWVSVVFSMGNRLADVLGFQIPSGGGTQDRGSHCGQVRLSRLHVTKATRSLSRLALPDETAPPSSGRTQTLRRGC